MRLSIITISYNSEEYIIVDGNSSDNTKSIIEKYKDKITHFISEPDNGIYDAMNKGLRMATGDLVGILNSDDVYAYNDVIKDVVENINNNITDSLYANLVYVDRNNTEKIRRMWIAGKYKPG